MIVKQLRQEKHWSQEVLAKISGLSVRTIQRIEKGDNASLETLQALAAVFEVDVAVLTHEISLIDKQSENWKSLPFWFRVLFFGIRSRKAQITAECSLFVLALLSVFVAQNKFLVAAFFVATWLTGWSIRYGDRKRIW